jgi:hypothetical protein
MAPDSIQGLQKKSNQEQQSAGGQDHGEEGDDRSPAANGNLFPALCVLIHRSFLSSRPV